MLRKQIWAEIHSFIQCLLIPATGCVPGMMLDSRDNICVTCGPTLRKFIHSEETYMMCTCNVISPMTSWQIDGDTMETVRDFILGGSKITTYGDCSHEIKRCCCLEESEKPRQCIKKQRYYLANKRPSSQSYGFSSSHVWM